MTGESKVVVDTSVAVPLLVASHEHHASVAAWARGRKLRLSGHALVETYAVLTRLPGDARLSAADAAVLIDENFAAPVILTVEGARAAHRQLADKGVVGGATYDGLVALAAGEQSAVLVTRDARARTTYEALSVTVHILATEA